MKQMKRGTGIAVLLVLVVVLGFFGWYALSILRSTGAGEDRNLKLGLDLAGGVSITYEVEGETPTDEQMSDTIMKLQQRIENDLGEESQTTEASVYPVGDDRISVEIPGVTDANKILEELGTPGQLYFITETDDEGNENYTYDSSTGEYTLNYEIDELLENGSIPITGQNVTSARAGYQTDQTTGSQDPVVDLTLDEEGAQAFETATEKAYSAGESIGIYYDGEFKSVPSVNSVISGGSCVIEGMSDYEEAEDLAAYIRIGGLDLQLKELQSEVVGAQLGGNALSSSLRAGGIGLLLVIAFLVIVYMVPGIASSLALLLYTALMISLLYWFDVTLTLPGIAGIILSIGMAVDANVIIFARVREEVENGKNLRAAVDIGFKKALSAILDGNITTLIAAAVLGILGSGSVRGFAVTLAMGVILSMFTALVITRLIIRAFLAVGLNNEKAYVKAIKTPKVDFIKKKAIFFVISIAVIGAGIIGMVVNAAGGNKMLNFSLEFLGGTSTTVSFHEEYTLEELDEIVVPVVSEITGDNDIQMQKVEDGETVIIKTRSLDLSEREALNEALEENFDIQEEEISSENIGSTISSEMRADSLKAVLVAALCMLIYIWIRFKDLRFASSAIIALLHDVLVVLALYALARLTVGSAFIACMLTVIGYSVNDTIVIFDRIRENRRLSPSNEPAKLKELCNESINQTLSRSISTSITTALTVLMLLILGVTTIREFALPLLAGVLVGTYSSICIATALWYLMRSYIGKKGEPEVTSQPRPKKKKPKAQRATKENQGIVV